MIRIIELNNGVVSIAPECLAIEPFKTLWESDKTKEKTEATKVIKYFWFYVDFGSPYFMYEEEVRHRLILEHVLNDKNFKQPKDFDKYVKSYLDANPRPAVEMLSSAVEVVHKMKDFFKSVDFTATQTNKMGVEEFTYDIDKITKAIMMMPKLIDSLNQATELAKKEQAGTSKVRGNAQISMLEDNKI